MTIVAGAARERRGEVLLAVTWLAATVFFAWALYGGVRSFESPVLIPGLFMLLLCAAALMWWTPNPVHDEPGDARTRRWLLSLLILLAAIVLFPLRTLIGPPLLFALPVVAVVVLIALRQPVTRREALYALLLALVAGLAGLGAGWISEFSPLAWALLQVALVLTGLLAGWAMLRHSGLAEHGVGKSLVLSAGASRGALGFLLGMLIAVPWGLANVAMGATASEDWLRSWWQPFVAIQPGIAEEAWGRLLLVPLLFLLFRRAARPRTALAVALVLAAYWFAYLHTPGGLEALPGTLIIGTLYVLPVSYLCLYRDLETAIGWHFAVDFVKFAFALMFVSG
jgi:hypothetical protein